MVHGTVGYFRERALCSRRSSLITLALSLGGLALVLAPAPKAVQKMLIETSRFGFEGPDQFVRRVKLENPGRIATLSDVGRLQPVSSPRKGGGVQDPRSRTAIPKPREGVESHAPSAEQLSARAVSRIPGVPVFQSEDLIIDRIVKPEYPPMMLEANIQGRVTLQALVDTTGKVIDVQVMNSAGAPLLDQAAADAIWLTRFRPFRMGGVVRQVYALVNINFRIYD